MCGLPPPHFIGRSAKNLSAGASAEAARPVPIVITVGIDSGQLKVSGIKGLSADSQRPLQKGMSEFYTFHGT